MELLSILFMLLVMSIMRSLLMCMRHLMFIFVFTISMIGALLLIFMISTSTVMLIGYKRYMSLLMFTRKLLSMTHVIIFSTMVIILRHVLIML